MRFATSRPYLVVAALYLAAALHALGVADIVGDDEAREAGIVQAIVGGDWLWPRFNGELIPDKPILYHWLAAVPCGVMGFSETAVRLPSAFAGAALIAWTGRFGAELLGPEAGLAAAGLLATTPTLLHHARVARPDLLLLLLVAVALGQAFRWWQTGRRRDATVALGALGAATLAKGPVAPALFAFTAGAFLISERLAGCEGGVGSRLPLGAARRRQSTDQAFGAFEGRREPTPPSQPAPRLRDFLTLPGVVAFVVLGLGWYAIALAGWGDAFVREHLVGRYARNLLGGLPAGGAYSTRGLAHHLFFYPKHLPAVAMPWTPLVLLALWRSARTGGLSDPRLRFLLCWTLAPVAVFAPAEWKLRYYLLPSLPALALITAPAAVALWRERSTRRWRALVGGIPAAALFVAGVWAVTSGRVSLSAADRSTVDAIVAAAGGPARVAAAAAVVAGAMLLLALARWRGVLAGVATGAVVWSVVAAPALERAVSRRDSLRGFAEAAAQRFPAPAPLVFFREPIRPVVVYVGRRVPTVARAVDAAPGAGLIARGAAYRTLADVGVLGAPLVTGEGRVGNFERARVVLAARAGAEPSAAAQQPRRASTSSARR